MTYQYAVFALDAALNQGAGSGAVSVTTPNTQPPTVPTGLQVSGTRVNLSLTASTDNVGVVGYNIYRGDQITVSTTTSYSDTGLADATAYQYLVSAFDAAGNVAALRLWRAVPR